MESAPTWKKLSKKEAEALDMDSAMGRIGTLGDITYDEIVAKVGLPTSTSRTRGDKVKARWIFQGSDGSWCMIYDYKSSTKYGDNEDFPPMDMSHLHDDPDYKKKVQELQKKKMDELKKSPAYKLGLHRTKEWSITGSAGDWKDYAMTHERKGTVAALDLAHSIFGDKVHGTSYGLEFERMFGNDPKPYVPSHLRNK